MPNLGAALIVAGLCNQEQKLIAGGSYLTSDYSGSANRRPKGVGIGSVTLDRPTAGADGSVRVRFDLDHGARFAARRHTADVMLVDAATDQPLPLDYNGLTTLRRSGDDITGLDLRLPAGSDIPDRVDAWVITDVFPLGARAIG